MEESRKQFEAWFNDKSAWKIKPSMRTKKGYANNPSAQEKWEVWQASRAAVEIELPKKNVRYPFDEAFDDGYTDGKNGAIQDCADAIRAAGLTVKGDSK